jgi:hypothetical protein
MIYRMARVRLAAAFTALLFVTCARAAPFAVQVGEARIGLDAPPGFADTSFTGSPRLQELAEALTSPSNRILLFAISDGDLRKFSLGDPPEFRRYMIAVTPKALERERVSAQRFAELAEAAVRELGERAPAGKSFSEYFDQRPVGASAVLGELRREAELVSVLVGARVQAQARAAKPQYMLSTVSLMLVRGKLLSLAVHSAYEGPADLEWIRGITARWVDTLQRLNAR